jgi:hypothetical protein
MRRETILPYLSQTCLGFSFTTSITLILMLNGHFVDYRPIAYARRIGASKVKHVRDTFRTAQIMMSVIAAHNPIKLAIMTNVLMILVAVIAGVLALMNNGTFGFFCTLLAAALSAMLPVVFLLGCLGELVRLRKHPLSS